MPKIAYEHFDFKPATIRLIYQCNDIIAEYTAQGYKLTLRQLYYQLVSRDIIANNVKEYNRLGNTVNDARLAGFIDWDAIEDRTRNLASVPHWTSPSDIIASAYASFRIDKWAEQPCRVEVWIEKEALAGVFERICRHLDVPYLSCRGYVSQSEMWSAAYHRYVPYIKSGKQVQILHFGDHDPSGIDMTRDIEDRLRKFCAGHVGSNHVRLDIKRVALNMDQVREYNPPENPAKSTDSRFQSYLAEYGDSSWELDALNPRVLSELVRSEVEALREPDVWQAAREAEAEHRALLRVAYERWTNLSDYIVDHWETRVDNYRQAELDE